MKILKQRKILFNSVDSVNCIGEGIHYTNCGCCFCCCCGCCCCCCYKQCFYKIPTTSYTRYTRCVDCKPVENFEGKLKSKQLADIFIIVIICKLKIIKFGRLKFNLCTTGEIETISVLYQHCLVALRSLQKLQSLRSLNPITNLATTEKVKKI